MRTLRLDWEIRSCVSVTGIKFRFLKRWWIPDSFKVDYRAKMWLLKSFFRLFLFKAIRENFFSILLLVWRGNLNLVGRGGELNIEEGGWIKV